MWSVAHAGEHPKTIQTLLRHSSITLIMDTYGHLFPGQAEAAVNKLHAIMVGPSISLPATGTEAASAVTPEFAQRLAQPAGDETLPERASRCDASGPTRAQTKPPKLRTWAVWCGLVRHRAQAAEERLEQPREPCGLEVVSETLMATSAFSAAARVYRVVLLFFRAFPGRLRQSFQDQVGRLDDPLITWTQIRFESFTRQVLQTNDIANANFITLLGGKLHVGILDHATGKFF